MSKHTAAVIINSTFPMWDNFEAVFFVLAGFSVGIVLGILFPSIWRSFRRKFRKETKYAPNSDLWDNQLNLNIKILSDNSEDEIENTQDNVLYLPVFKAFTSARYYFQIGDTRKAVNLYIEILTSESVSKQDTNRALYELSQVYLSTGLLGRALDTALELLNRKPKQNQVLLNVLKIFSKNFFEPEKLMSILDIYKGVPDGILKRTISHSLSRISEIFLKKNDVNQAIEYARLGVKWDRTSGRALTLLWETTSQHFLQKNKDDEKLVWISFATDLEAIVQINITSKISSAAFAHYLSTLIHNLVYLPNSLDNYKEIELEFKSSFNWEKISETLQKKLLESIFYAIILIRKTFHSDNFNNSQIFEDILFIISNGNHKNMLNFLHYYEKFESYLLLGFFAHQCRQCQTVFAEFSWECSNCGLKESLFPVT